MFLDEELADEELISHVNVSVKMVSSYASDTLPVPLVLLLVAPMPCQASKSVKLNDTAVKGLCLFYIFPESRS